MLGDTYAGVAVDAHVAQSMVAVQAVPAGVVHLAAMAATVAVLALVGVGAVVCGAAVAPDAGQQISACLLEPREEALGDLLAHHRCAVT